jgi:hypothetical protein
MQLFIKRNLNEIDQMLMQMEDSVLTRRLDIFNGATIGQHVRHILELYICLFDGLPEGEICYDKRKRDLYLESNCDYARATIHSIINRISQVKDDREVFLQSDFAHETGEPLLIRSTLNRELAYNLEHSIHHQALIKIGISQLDEKIELSENFGVAPATIRHQKEVCAQ